MVDQVYCSILQVSFKVDISHPHTTKTNSPVCEVTSGNAIEQCDFLDRQASYTMQRNILSVVYHFIVYHFIL